MINEQVRKNNYCFQIDIIKSIAMVLVIGIHFLSYSGNLTVPIEGINAITAISLWTLFDACVPLFFMCTGFLLAHRRFSLKKHYLKIARVILEYIFASLFCIFFKFYIFENFSIGTAFKELVKFSAAPYAWYVRHYLILFAIIPFLNKVYELIKNKILFIILLILLMSIGTYFRYRVDFVGFYLLKNLFSVVYYFMGKYIRDRGIPCWLTVRRCGMAVVLAVLLKSGLEYKINFGEIFYAVPNGYGALCTVVVSFFLFCFLYQLFFEKRNSKHIEQVSQLTLLVYLISWIFDSMFYTGIKNLLHLNILPLWSIFIIVPAILALSLLCAICLRKLIISLEKVLGIWIRKVFKCKIY